ncbi:VOC family protein [Thermoactinomyces mirandus]|uniref:VOC family protein n=1 Tax=Thermoactinomyces mirandus TaxID=2756294 RepID=UPI0035E41C34
MKTFYATYFNGKASAKYHNEEKQFESYFLTFDGGARLEIMHKAGIDKPDQDNRIGWAHIAISQGEQGVRQSNDRTPAT